MVDAWWPGGVLVVPGGEDSRWPLVGLYLSDHLPEILAVCGSEGVFRGQGWCVSWAAHGRDLGILMFSQVRGRLGLTRDYARFRRSGVFQVLSSGL